MGAEEAMSSREEDSLYFCGLVNKNRLDEFSYFHYTTPVNIHLL